MKKRKSKITGHLDIFVNENVEEVDDAKGTGAFYDRYISKDNS